MSITSCELITSHTHSFVIDESVEPTCTSSGLTAGQHCTECGKISVEQDFAYSSSLKNIEVDPNNPYYSTINGNLYSKDGSIMYYFAMGKQQETVVIPEGVTAIHENAFSWHENIPCVINTVIFPSTLERIGDNAFDTCKTLTTVILPEGTKAIGKSVFSGCKALTEVQIPSSITEIGHSAFSGCISLKSIDLSSTTILDLESTFYGCTALTNVSIPKTIKTIGSSTFYNCKSLTSINYMGTRNDWMAVTLISTWDSNSGAYTIYCTNGNFGKYVG